MKRALCLFLAGGSLYPSIELAWRKKTHISMSFAGGICLCLIDRVCNRCMKKKWLPLRCMAGSGIITGVEFLIGLVVNVAGKRNVWDYSSMPLNVMGQICLPFSIAWCFLTLPAMWFCNLFHRHKSRR